MDYVDYHLKRTTLAHSSQDCSPLHPFYALSSRGAELDEKAHNGLSLSSFPAFSSRKDFRANLVSFMLVKLSEQPSSQYRFNLFWPNWTTNCKEVSHPLKDGRALLCTLLSFFGHRRLSTKKIPHCSFLHAFRLSRNESTIEHLLSWAR